METQKPTHLPNNKNPEQGTHLGAGTYATISNNIIILQSVDQQVCLERLELFRLINLSLEHGLIKNV